MLMMMAHCVDTVGGGTSGAVIASRLAEDKDKSILVIEAGGEPSDEPIIDVPLLADSARGSDYDWQYHTVPQKHGCLGHKEQVNEFTLIGVIRVVIFFLIEDSLNEFEIRSNGIN